MMFKDIPPDDFKTFAEILFGGKVNSVTFEDKRTVVVNIDTEWEDDDEVIKANDDVYFRVPLIDNDGSIQADWSISETDIDDYYHFLMAHEVNPLIELLS